MERIRRKKQYKKPRTLRAVVARFLDYTLAALLCFILAFCTSLGPIFRSQDIKVHLGSIADFSLVNAFIFVAAFIIYALILTVLIYYGKNKKFLPKYQPFTKLIKSIALRKNSENKKQSKLQKFTTKHTIFRNISHFLLKSAKLFFNCAKWFINHSTRNRRNLLLTFFVGWIWVPATLLAAYGADICSQIREYSWTWNKITGLDQPYIGFFSFVPMDIYPTAHYLWPTHPTYLTDQHNIVLTVIYGATTAVSRYFTDSNDAGIALLAFAQFVFAAWCVSATAHRFLNKPWLNAESSSTNCSTTTFARFVILLMFLLNPLVLCSTIALTKSPLFAFAFVWWFGINYELTNCYHAKGTKNTPSTKPSAQKPRLHTVLELIVSVCVMLIAAKYAWYILVVQFMLLIIFERKRWRLWVCGILLPIVVIHGSLIMLISSGAIISGDPIESRGIQLQQIARIAKLDPHSIPRSAKRIIAPIFNLDQTAEAYKPYDADPVKSSGLQSKKVSYRWRYVTKDNIRKLDFAWWQMITHSPFVATDAFLAKTYGYFDIFDRPYVGPEYYIDTDSIHKSDWIKYWNPKWRTKFAEDISTFSDIPVLSWPIHGNTFVIFTLLIGVAEIILRRWRTLLWHIPLALLVGVMILAPANNFERHMLPLAFVFCFVALTFWRDTFTQSRYNSRECQDQRHKMDEKNTPQFAQDSSAASSIMSEENYEDKLAGNSLLSSDFLSILASVQTAEKHAEDSNIVNSLENQQLNKTQVNAVSNDQESSSKAEQENEEKHKHHLWHRLSSNQSRSSHSSQSSENTKGNNSPSFTPLPSAQKSTSSEPLRIFDNRDGQVFDAAMRLQLHSIIATCLMNGIADARIDAFMHLLQWSDSPKVIVIAGTFGTAIKPDDGPNRKPAPDIPPDNTDTLRRNIWPQLGSCNAYDAIVERTQSSALQRITGAWQKTQALISASTKNSSTFAAPSHIILLAVRENPSDQALEKLCKVFENSHKTICVSSMVEGVEQISSALTATLAAIAVAPAVKHLPQIIHTDDLLPERALIGDATAFDTLYNKVYQSLAPYSHDDPTLETIDMFLRFGGALDQTAHELNVHPNTVRYRLRKVAQTTGWDATDPRAAYVLQTAITIGRIRDSH